MAKHEKGELKFREDDGSVKGRGATAPNDKCPWTPIQKDALKHPEKYYCEKCGASFASHPAQGCTP